MMNLRYDVSRLFVTHAATNEPRRSQDEYYDEDEDEEDDDEDDDDEDDDDDDAAVSSTNCYDIQPLYSQNNQQPNKGENAPECKQS